MSRRREPHPIYRVLLHLYPKAHRQAYGEQMVQTLDDILADQPNRYQRFIVWLRVASELPINIIEENINNRGNVSVNKLAKVTNRQFLYIILAVLILGSYVIIALIWRHERAEVSSLNSQLQTVSDNQSATNGGSYNAVTIIPSENTVYLPLAKLKLPATTLNEGLVYGYTPAHTEPGLKKLFPAELDISTHDLAVNDYSTTRQFDCSQVAYADFTTPSYAMNPMWKADGSVTLADGRTMHIYYAPSIPGCKASWQLNHVDASAIAQALKQAVSY